MTIVLNFLADIAALRAGMHATQKPCNPFLFMAVIYVGAVKACPLISKSLKFM